MTEKFTQWAQLATTGGRNHWKSRLITTSDVKLWTYFLSNYFFVFLRLYKKRFFDTSGKCKYETNHDQR